MLIKTHLLIPSSHKEHFRLFRILFAVTESSRFFDKVDHLLCDGGSKTLFYSLISLY